MFLVRLLLTIQEFDLYVSSIDPLTYTDNIYQQNIDNKVNYLMAL